MTMREEFLYLCHACTLPALVWIATLYFEPMMEDDWKPIGRVAILGAWLISFISSEFVALSSETGREHPIASSVAAAAIWLILQAAEILAFGFTVMVLRF